jgi:protein involved in polysaccharide export with SLBB domain
VTGEVKAPGGYPYEEGLSVQKAIAIAGGLTEKAERADTQILRHHDGKEETLPAALDALVVPDDIIVVPERQKFYISGEVKTPGRYFFEKGMTVNKAMSLAGGPTDKAEKVNIKITRITEKLAATMVVDPDSVVLPDDIIVVEPQHQKFYASGEVKNPGGYPHKDSLTVHKAIAMAGGVTEKAERGNPRVLRSINGREETLEVKLDTLVLPDDIIVVAEGERFYVNGEIKTPGRYLHEQGMTVHKAITMAGGLTEKAEKGAIKLTRLVNGSPQTIDVGLDAPIVPDDFISVPQMHKVYVNGEVKNAGNYPYERGLTVHKVVTMAGGFTDKAAIGKTKILRRINGAEQSIRVSLDAYVLPEDIVVVPRSFF